MPLRLLELGVGFEDLDQVRFLGAAGYDQADIIQEYFVILEGCLIYAAFGFPRLVVERVWGGKMRLEPPSPLLGAPVRLRARACRYVVVFCARALRSPPPRLPASMQCCSDGAADWRSHSQASLKPLFHLLCELGVPRLRVLCSVVVVLVTDVRCWTLHAQRAYVNDMKLLSPNGYR